MTAIAIAGLRHDRVRTALAIVGITLAVLATTLLAGTGYGVIETGEEKFTAAERDLWITGGAVQFAPGTVGGIENPIHDAHPTAREIQQREAVKTAVPLSFQTVYVSADRNEYETLVGVGGPGQGGSVTIVEGRSFTQSDVHYADGSYDGPMTMEVIIDRQTAELLNVSVGDTLYIGGTIADAREYEFTVVGISPTYSRFLGTPTVVIQLSELQRITGTTGTDSASIITISLADDASSDTVAAELQEKYPEYEVRTNREQLQATLERQAVILASGISLVVLAIIAGITLTVNLMLGIVYQQRREFAALRATGLSGRTLIGIVTLQAVVLGVLGGGVGVGLTWPLATALDAIASSLVGFDNVVRVPRSLLAGGFAIALVMSTIGGMTAAWRLVKLDVLEQLE